MYSGVVKSGCQGESLQESRGGKEKKLSHTSVSSVTASHIQHDYSMFSLTDYMKTHQTPNCLVTATGNVMDGEKLRQCPVFTLTLDRSHTLSLTCLIELL